MWVELVHGATRPDPVMVALMVLTGRGKSEGNGYDIEGERLVAVMVTERKKEWL